MALPLNPGIPIVKIGTVADKTATTINPLALKTAINVDVGDKTVVPTVVRDGQEVQPPPLNPAKVGDLLTRLRPITRVNIPRIMSQSIPPGTRVQKGTPVDIVLLPVSDIDFTIFDNVHDDFKLKSVEQVLPIVDDLKTILVKDKAADLNADEKAVVISKLGAAGITVDDTKPTKSLEVAFNTLKSAKAFQ